jgi:hypothetical protein
MTPLSLFITSAALAQTRPDQEYQGGDVAGDGKLVVTGDVQSDYYEFANTDFRKLDESSDQAILDSDDRGTFAFTGANLGLAYRIDDRLRVVFEAGHRGLWGDDQIGSVNEFGGFLYIPSMFAEYSTAPEGGVKFTVGRQFFSIGGMGGARDYVLADVLDMVRVDIPLGTVGELTLVPLNIYTNSDDLAETNFVSLLGQQNAETFEFRGDTITRRFGGRLQLDEMPGPLDLTAYGFQTFVGARGTGSDLSFDGALGNFSDKDWVLNLGLRAAADFDLVVPYAHFDVSRGIDRKELEAQDVDTNGISYGGGVRLEGRSLLEDGPVGFWGELSYFDALGPAYSANGLQYSHGYVGMKGQQVGGALANRFMGWHPSAYVGRFGVTDRPHDIERIAGTRALHASGGLELGAGFTAWAGWWLMQDHGLTQLEFSDLDNLNPPYGYSRAEFAAERRLGTTLGQELDVELGWKFGEHVEVYSTAATFMPGPYYRIEVDRVAGTALGSSAPVPAWMWSAGTQVRF